jgi:anthranilate synthase component 2
MSVRADERRATDGAAEGGYRDVSEDRAMILMIDNYDSFTYNLVQYFGELGAEVQVFRNDQISVDQVAALKPSHIVLSPGPCTPNEAGICLDLLDRLKGRFPILGVCLGHQAIGQAFGGHVVRARQIMHGKTSPIHHQRQGVFTELPSPFTATRYHSLIVERSTLPTDFEVTGWTETTDGSMDEIMGLRHRRLPIEGVQFHPESILTEHGPAMLKNFLGAY